MLTFFTHFDPVKSPKLQEEGSRYHELSGILCDAAELRFLNLAFPSFGVSPEHEPGYVLNKTIRLLSKRMTDVTLSMDVRNVPRVKRSNYDSFLKRYLVTVVVILSSCLSPDLGRRWHSGLENQFGCRRQ